MNKAFLGFAALLFIGLLTACNQLAQYTISEQEINQALQKHNNFAKDIGISGLVSAHIVLSDLNSEVGREEPNKVTLSGNAEVNISSLLGTQHATMKLKMKTSPFFDQQQGAIYLKDLEIMESQIQPEKMQPVLQSLIPYLNQSLKSYFDQKPVYVLSTDRSKAESLAKTFAKGLIVKPGELVIPFTE